MRKITPEALLTIGTVILLTLLPLLVGWLMVKAYRLFRPINEEELTGLASIGAPERDGFIKIVVVGWAICGPTYYWVFSSGVLG